MALSMLPPEVLSNIVVYAPTANFLRNLALTCRTLHDFVEAEGWRIFSHAQFPSFVVPPPYKDAAHSLTTLSRNWDRRAFVAKPVHPHSCIHELPSGKVNSHWSKPTGQTMGYQPVIDSYEEWTGGDWSSRREVLAWGAGAELVMKWTERGGKVARGYYDTPVPLRKHEYEDSGTKFKWFTYREPFHDEGKDDIVSAHILRPNQKQPSQNSAVSEDVLIGRASGELSLVKISEGARNCIIKSFETGNRQIKTADLSSSYTPLASVCLADESIAIFSLDGDENPRTPLNHIKCIDAEEEGLHIWSTRFLRDDRVAVGRGLTDTPVVVYDVSKSGTQPLRKFGGGRVDGQDASTSIYPIATIPESYDKDDASGNVFLAGGYDGNIRLYDMRSPSDCEAIISDETDIMPIFSLLMVGRERVVAGGNKHSLLKMFDLRMQGGRAYSYLEVPHVKNGTALERNGHIGSRRMESRQLNSRGWNVFASSRDSKSRRYDYSPVYSLSSPSHSSSSLYVGLENSVVHLNFTSIQDKHPDPLYKHSIFRIPSGGVHVKRTWSSGPIKTLSLSMYEQTLGKMDLMVQRPVAPVHDSQGILPEYDERWMDVRYEDSIRRGYRKPRGAS